MNKLVSFLKFLQGDGRRAALCNAAGSLALLCMAWYSEYVLRLLPCELCFWQRKPHLVIVALGVLGFLVRVPKWRAAVLGLIVLAALANVGIASFHVGVEYHWWEGLKTCSAPTAITRTLEEARELIFNSHVVACDKPAAIILGLSMAGWNALISLAMAVWAGFGLRRTLASSK